MNKELTKKLSELLLVRFKSIALHAAAIWDFVSNAPENSRIELMAYVLEKFNPSEVTDTYYEVPNLREVSMDKLDKIQDSLKSKLDLKFQKMTLQRLSAKEFAEKTLEMINERSDEDEKIFIVLNLMFGGPAPYNYPQATVRFQNINEVINILGEMPQNIEVIKKSIGQEGIRFLNFADQASFLRDSIFSHKEPKKQVAIVYAIISITNYYARKVMIEDLCNEGLLQGQPADYEDVIMRYASVRNPRTTN
ncbi:MAG: hypothetical protein NT136_02985 [Candidatus Moranbacteria bacterium]|nr:hypothetical protein [Candidatus Moranbacteria bacterium]